MSVHVLSWVLKHSPVDTPGHRLVLLVLADHANDDGTGAWPSVKTIADEAKQSERNVQYALRALEGEGHIRKAGRSPYGTTIYDVLTRGGANLAPRDVGGATVAPKPSEPSLTAGLSALEQPTEGTTDGFVGLGANVAPLAAPQGAGPANRVWLQMLELCRAEVTEFIATTWLEPIRGLAIGDDELLLAAPNHICGWVRDRYSELLRATAAAVLGREVRVKLVQPFEEAA